MDKMASETPKITLESRLVLGWRRLAILPIALVLLLFVVMNYLSSQYRASVASALLNKQLAEMVSERNQLESRQLNQLFNEVVKAAYLMQQEHQRVLKSAQTDDVMRPPESMTAIGENGSSVYQDVAGLVFLQDAGPLSAQQQRLAAQTASLQALYQSIVQLNSAVAQIYFISTDGFGRIYPFRSQLPESIRAASASGRHPFFELVSKQQPQSGHVWTQFYNDATGLGWVISVVVPVYLEQQLAGVIGIDIPLQFLLAQSEQQAGTQTLLLDVDKKLLFVSDKLAQLAINQSPDTEAPDVAPLSELSPGRLLSLTDSALGTELMRVLSAGTQPGLFQLGGAEYVVSVSEQPEGRLQLLTLRSTNEIREVTKRVEHKDWQLLLASTLILLLVSVLVLRAILNRLTRSATAISSPIVRLSEESGRLARHNGPIQAINIDTNIHELTVLVSNLNLMTSRLADKAKRLHEADLTKQLLEEKARMYQMMANTDALTGMNNRKFVDSLFRHEAIRASRNNTALSVMLLDIDFFKKINDTYGHQTGDQVLKRVAKALKSSVRAIDTVGRWGGEEFILVCPDTALAPALELAEKVRLQIEQLPFEGGLRVTASIGVTQYQPGERTERAIARADNSLYRAKHNGRNRVECYTVEEQEVL